MLVVMVLTLRVAGAVAVDPPPELPLTATMVRDQLVATHRRAAVMEEMVEMAPLQVARMVLHRVVVVVVPNEDVALQHPEAMERMVASS